MLSQSRLNFSRFNPVPPNLKLEVYSPQKFNVAILADIGPGLLYDKGALPCVDE